MTWVPRDSKGIHLQGIGRADASVNVEGNVTNQILLTDTGVVFRLVVTRAVGSATFTMTDNDGTTIYEGDLDQGGNFYIGEYYDNGLKITTSGFNGGFIRVVRLLMK